MARSLLIALLSVAAVAGPAAGQVGPVWPPSPEEPPTLETILESAAALACSTFLCSQLTVEERCRPLIWDSGTNEPGFSFELDPDYCIRRIVDRLPPADFEGSGPEADELAPGSSEPAPESTEPAPADPES